MNTQRAAQFIRLEPLKCEAYRRVTVVCRHACDAYLDQPLVTQFSAMPESSNTGTGRECGCVVVVPEARWQRFIQQSALEWAVWSVRQEEASCGVKS